MAAQPWIPPFRRIKLERLENDDLRELNNNFRWRSGEAITNSKMLAFALTKYGLSTGRKLESLKLRSGYNADDDPVQMAKVYKHIEHETGDILHFLATSTTLQKFALSGRMLYHPDRFVAAAQSNIHLQKLSLMCRNLPMRSICELIRTTKTLRHLELCGSRSALNSQKYIFNHDNTAEFLGALATNTSLDLLELSLLELSLDNDDVSDLASTMRQPTTQSRVRTLKLDDNTLDQGACLDLLFTFPLLQTAHLFSNRAPYEGFFTPLRRLSTLHSFHFSSSYFAPTHNDILNQLDFQDLLFNNPGLTDLEICDRCEAHLENEVITQIGMGLANSSSMKSLAFANPLTDNNLHCLLHSFVARGEPLVVSSLSLEFRNERTLPNSLYRLLADPASNCTIIKLTLDFGELTNAILHELWMCLRQNTSLESLVLKGSGADSDIQSLAAFRSLAEGLPQLTLKELTFDEGLRASLMGLKCLIAFPLDDGDPRVPLVIASPLSKLTLSWMVFGKSMVQYCAKLIGHSNCFLRELSLHHCRVDLTGFGTLLEALTLPSSVLDSFAFTNDYDFSLAETNSLVSILPRIANLKNLTLGKIPRDDSSLGQTPPGLKDCILGSLSKNRSLQLCNLELEMDGFVFQSMIRFYGHRNRVDFLLAQEEAGGDRAGWNGEDVGRIQPQWLALLEGFLSKEETGCHSAAFHLLSRKLDLIMPPVNY